MQQRTVSCIPLRNIWLLLLYAYDKARFLGAYDAEIERSRDLDELIALLLADAVERRLHRSLTRNYVSHQAILKRVRGRIDVLRTCAGSLLDRGEVACRFDDHTSDTPRNRFVRRALEDVATNVADAALRQRCRNAARQLRALGVGDLPGPKTWSKTWNLARHEGEDEFMVTLARWVYELVLPTEEDGSHLVASPDKSETLVRTLFERAVANFYRVELLSSEGWHVHPQKKLGWQETEPSGGLEAVLPKMTADIVIRHGPSAKRLVVETKFTNILTRNHHGQDRLKSLHIYQVYAYLRSQEHVCGTTGADGAADASALVIYPAVDRLLDEFAVFHGHRMYFATVDLGASTQAVCHRLRELVRRAF